MKHSSAPWFITLVLPIIILAACKKETVIPDDKVVIEVKEFGTNTPVPGAKIELSRCTNYSAYFGCISWDVFSSVTTDGSGKATVSKDTWQDADKGAKVSAAGYFSWQAFLGTNFLDRETTVNVTILPDGQAHAGEVLYINASTSHASYQVLDLPSVPTASLTTTMKAIAGQANDFHWRTVSSSSGIVKQGSLNSITPPANIVIQL